VSGVELVELSKAIRHHDARSADTVIGQIKRG
jgi:hypothetical protein